MAGNDLGDCVRGLGTVVSARFDRSKADDDVVLVEDLNPAGDPMSGRDWTRALSHDISR